MTQFKWSKKILIATVTVSLSACVLTDESSLDSSVPTGPVHYTVQQDDRLSDIAYAITGSTESWVVIAKHNNVSDARKIQVGDVLEIPAELLQNVSTNPKSDGGVLAINTLSSGDSSNQPDSSRTVESEVDVVLRPVNVNRRFNLSEVDMEIDRESAARASTAKIRVLGTYFPKGVYAQPNESAKLISRVAPGTIFDLDAELDGWYRIRFQTDTVFIRAIDGKIFFPDKPEIL